MTFPSAHLGKILFCCALSIAAMHGQPAVAASLTGLLTSAETSKAIASFEGVPISSARANQDALQRIEQTVHKAQQGEPYYRRPVSAARIKTLQQRLTTTTGQSWTYQRTAATVDYFQAHRRESSAMARGEFFEKLRRSAATSRPGHHGLVSEFAEARARGMMLTKDTRSQTFDLTQSRARPRSAQLKVYQNSMQGLRSLQHDVAHLPGGSRNGILPREQLEQLRSRGAVVARKTSTGQRVYLPTSGPKVRVSAMRSFRSASASQHYGRLGRSSVANLYREARAGGAASRFRLGVCAAEAGSR